MPDSLMGRASDCGAKGPRIESDFGRKVSSSILEAARYARNHQICEMQNLTLTLTLTLTPTPTLTLTSVLMDDMKRD